MNRWQSGGAPGTMFGGVGMTPAVKGLLIANAIVFVLQLLTGTGKPYGVGVIQAWCDFVPRLAINELQIWRFFTYMFLHGDFGHIFFNMFGLWMFGTSVEALWGQRTFLIYYFVCGLGGALLYGIFNLSGINSIVPMLGASGAVFGILLAYGMTFPDRIILFMFILPIKAKYLVVIFGLIELLSIPQADHVARLAHLGGMLSGFLFLRFTAPSLTAGTRVGRGPDVGGAWRRFKTKRRVRIVRPDRDAPRDGRGFDDHRSKPRDTGEIDRILDKISRQGLQSLTDEEQEILRRAGRK